VAGKVGTIVKSRWARLQEPSTRHAVQDRMISAAATTGAFLRRGLSGTKEKVVVGKSKVEEVMWLCKWFLSNCDIYLLVIHQVSTNYIFVVPIWCSDSLFFLSFIWPRYLLFQVAKITAQKSKTILTDIERWQKVYDIWQIMWHLFISIDHSKKFLLFFIFFAGSC